MQCQKQHDMSHCERLLFKIAELISVLYFCFSDLSTQNFEIIDAFMLFV
jgi:hypothetical protein